MQVRGEACAAIKQALSDLDQVGDSTGDKMVALALISRAHAALEQARKTLAADLVANDHAPSTLTAKAAMVSHTTASRWVEAAVK